MVRDPEFEHRAFGAAGPVGLVALGLVLLAVLAIPLVLGYAWPPLVTWTLGAVGVLALVAGIVWGGVQESRGAAERR